MKADIRGRGSREECDRVRCSVGCERREICRSVRVARRLVLLAICASVTGACESRSATTADARPRQRAVSTLKLPRREPGPPRAETAAEVQRERDEAARLVTALRQGGVSTRQVASMADIRGYRHYRVRRYRRAQVWFETAVRVDASYELGLYNASRVAVLLKELPLAARRLRKLHELETPLGQRALGLAATDPDLAALRELLRQTK